MKKTLFFRSIAIAVLVSFMMQSLLPSASYAQSVMNLPAPGAMVTPSAVFTPVMVKGLEVHPENPLLFDFIVDSGRPDLKIDSKEFKDESQKLIKYFLASLTIKEDDLWVNLSPYEHDRMITNELGKTELGRDMLAQDYVLKQLTASLMYPEKDLGKAFWDKVYAKVQENFGAVEIPVDTFNKVWITADKAKVLERHHGGYIVDAHLKVMLEEDYVATSNNALPTRGHVAPPVEQVARGAVSPSTLPTPQPMNTKALQGSTVTPNDPAVLVKQATREIIIPEIEKEVNQGQNFAPLRQMFYAMILATWYKAALKDALLNQVYTDKGKIDGVLSNDLMVKEKIYAQYLEAFKKGVFNYIKEDVDVLTQEAIPRKYFSGGIPKNFAMNVIKVKNVSSAEETKIAQPAGVAGRVQTQVRGTFSRRVP
ncbi:MAG: hypothetical protein HQL22_06865, partial [Candidatus Omnitrophica bacterium]|nr:hypothetical protein [Candidatus Omnitrophota bacterium]